MAPIKFEEHLKEKLEKRTIQPSPEAWDTLENHLDQQGKKLHHSTFWWLGIAASIVGIALVTALIFDGSESKTIEPTVVDVDNNETLNTNAVVSEDVEVSEQKSVDDSKPEIKLSNEKETIPKATRSSEIISINEKLALKGTVASNDEKEQVQTQKGLETPINSSEFEKAKLNDVIAEINRLNDENHGVTEAEIDSLLKRAEREILTNRIYNENTKTVDANALLQDVEADLEQSFRTRVFEALKNSYVTVKTAVAERNN